MRLKSIVSRSVLLGLLLATQIASAQEVIIRERPVRPRYERVAAPGPRHVWIEEEWEPRGGRYVFVGGRWAEPPAVGMVWIPGHWAQRPRGEVWVRGHWREARRR